MHWTWCFLLINLGHNLRNLESHLESKSSLFMLWIALIKITLPGCSCIMIEFLNKLIYMHIDLFHIILTICIFLFLLSLLSVDVPNLQYFFFSSGTGYIGLTIINIYKNNHPVLIFTKNIEWISLSLV